jgi:acetyl-CoA/propionyl-CoA carboxylase biotin carboxyl carrier protein
VDRPAAEAIEAMGSKIEARERMRRPASESCPGVTEPVETADEVRAPRRRARLADRDQGSAAAAARAEGRARADEAARALESAQREGEAYFSDAAVYVERYLEDPRTSRCRCSRIPHGNVIHLGERDCTIQRRHRSSSRRRRRRPSTTTCASGSARSRSTQRGRSATRARARSRAALARRRVLLPRDEHPHPGRAHRDGDGTGLDLIREQVLIAAGETLSLRQEDVRSSGTRSSAASIARTWATASFRRRERSRVPGAERPGRARGLRRRRGSEISPLYDPMIAKLIVHGVDREHARRRMLRALGELEVEGVKTLIGFHKALLTHPCFIEGGTCHGVVELIAERAGRTVHTGTCPRHRTCPGDCPAQSGSWR